jgi:hypothetical protein
MPRSNLHGNRWRASTRMGPTRETQKDSISPCEHVENWPHKTQPLQCTFDKGLDKKRNFQHTLLPAFCANFSISDTADKLRPLNLGGGKGVAAKLFVVVPLLLLLWLWSLWFVMTALAAVTIEYGGWLGCCCKAICSSVVIVVVIVVVELSWQPWQRLPIPFACDPHHHHYYYHQYSPENVHVDYPLNS